MRHGLLKRYITLQEFVVGKMSSFDLGVVTSANGKPKHMKILTSIFASIFLAATSAQAQDGPSYEETTSFIQSKLDGTLE